MKLGWRGLIVGTRVSNGEWVGTVVKHGSKYLHVQTDSNKKLKFEIQGAGGFSPSVEGLRVIKFAPGWENG